MANIEIAELDNGRKRITVNSQDCSVLDKSIETNYPLELIKQVLDVKGPASLCDEIRREEDPLYVKINLEKDILSYVPEKDFANRRILDFGCGGGASTIILARMFPQSEIVGIDLSKSLISLACSRARHYSLDNLTFLCSPDSKTLPSEIGSFNYVINFNLKRNT